MFDDARQYSSNMYLSELRTEPRGADRAGPLMTPISDLPSSPSSRRHENTEIYAVTPHRTPYSAGRQESCPEHPA